jgi:hypothetical protein
MRRTFGAVAWLMGLSLFCGTAPAALLGVSTQIGQPTISLTNPSTTVWNKTAGTLTVTADPYQFRMDALSGFQSTGTPRSLVFKLRVDPVSGTLAGGVTGDDFVLEGQIDGTYNGVLLKGEIEAFGFLNLTGATDFLDFRFRVTGGALANHPNFLGKDIGVTITVENSTMSGVKPFAAAGFTGNAKGSLGPIASLTPCSASLGDVVWSDDNGNGRQDPGEQGLDNVTVRLLQGGNVLQTVNTGPGPLGQRGYYQFANLCAGLYSVEAVPPNGYSPSPANAATTTAADDSNPNPAAITLTANDSADPTVDFGFVPSTGPAVCEGEIGDLVFEDTNRNGIRETGEPGIEATSVTLLRTLDGIDEWVETVQTGIGGSYLFQNLCAGSYVVRVETGTLPAGLVASPTYQGGDTAQDSNASPSPVNLATNASKDPTVDFGYHRPCSGSIGDYLWNDANRNGVQDGGLDELGIDGVHVYLLDDHNTVIQTTTTGQNPAGGASGYYRFDQLCQGSYRIDVDERDLPANFAPSLGGQGPDRSLDSNADNQDPKAPVLVGLADDFAQDSSVDFGYYACTGSIGNFVWHDKNRNGAQDADEPGLDGLTVKVRNADGAVIATGTSGPHPTDGTQGFYRIGGLCAGTYSVEVDTATDLLNGFSPTTPNAAAVDQDSNPNPSTVALPSDFHNDDTLDFGFKTPCTGELGDFVFEDLNRDGIQDPNEPGLGGVLVVLNDLNGTEIARTFTDGTPGNQTGRYRFTGLCPAAYQVAVATPDGLEPTTPAAPGSTPANDSNDTPATIVLGEAETNPTVDFGFSKPCSGAIGDRAWKDLDFDGIQDADEPGLAGVTVKLLGAGNTVLQTATTTATGTYRFERVCPGNYKVEVETPAGYGPTTVNAAGSTADDDSNPATSHVKLDEAQTDASVDFGFRGTGRLGNFLWHDLNRNGLQDGGEPGLNGIRVFLKDAGGHVLAETLTQANPQGGQLGWYRFDGLNGGVAYTVEPDTYTLPLGFTPTLANVPPPEGSPATDSNGLSATVTLPADDAEDLTLDFGYLSPCTGEMGDTVWHDLNLDGVQDAGEPGLDGVSVTLFDAAGGVVETVTTATGGPGTQAGYYRFTGLCAGTYRVEVSTPAGFSPTTPGVGGDPAQDSNGSGTAVTLHTDADIDATVDFGFTSPCAGTLGDFVWRDDNRDGLQDANEAGFNGATVNLYDANGNGPLATATTANHPTTGQPGYYQFTGQCPGTYKVALAVPAGYGLTVPQAGTDRSIDSNPNPTTVELATVIASVTTVDFGLVQPSSGGGDGDDDTCANPGALTVLTVKYTGTACDGSNDHDPGQCPGGSGHGDDDDHGHDGHSGSGHGDDDDHGHDGHSGSDHGDDDDHGHDGHSGDGRYSKDGHADDSHSGGHEQKGCHGGYVHEDEPEHEHEPEPEDHQGHGQCPPKSEHKDEHSYDKSSALGSLFKKLGLHDDSHHGHSSHGGGHESHDGRDEDHDGKDNDHDGYDDDHDGKDEDHDHGQNPAHLVCTGDPKAASPVRIVASDSADPSAPNARIWFDGVVALDATFDIRAAVGGATALGADTYVLVYNQQGILLQTIKFRTTTSDPLRIGDRFGSIEIVGISKEGTQCDDDGDHHNGDGDDGDCETGSDGDDDHHGKDDDHGHDGKDDDSHHGKDDGHDGKDDDDHHGKGDDHDGKDDDDHHGKGDDHGHDGKDDDGHHGKGDGHDGKDDDDHHGKGDDHGHDGKDADHHSKSGDHGHGGKSCKGSDHSGKDDDHHSGKDDDHSGKDDHHSGKDDHHSGTGDDHHSGKDDHHSGNDGDHSDSGKSGKSK